MNLRPTILLSLLFLSGFVRGEEAAHFELNDAKWSEFSSEIHDTGSLGLEPFSLMNTDISQVFFVPNGSEGGTALEYANSANTGSTYIQGTVVNLGDKFTLEAKIKKGDESTGNIYLLYDNNSFSWFLDSTGVLHLQLTNGIQVKSAAAVLTDDNTWINLQAIVDLSQENIINAITLFKNGAIVALDSNFSYAPGTTMDWSHALRMLRRDAYFTLATDFVKLTKYDASETISPDNFYGGETQEGVEEGSSASILINPSTFFRRTANKPADINSNGSLKSGVGLVFDTHPNPECVFHGIFLIEFALEAGDLSQNITIDIFIKKPDETEYKKIGELVPGAKPSAGTWLQRYFWNSRIAQYDWTEGDAQPYRQSGSMKFKFEIR